MGKRSIYEGIFIALANPKTMLFFTAFLPQFVDTSLSPGRQMILLSLTFTTMALLLDSCYAILAARLKSAVTDPRRQVWFRKLSGSILIGAGVGLGLARGK